MDAAAAVLARKVVPSTASEQINPSAAAPKQLLLDVYPAAYTPLQALVMKNTDQCARGETRGYSTPRHDNHHTHELSQGGQLPTADKAILRQVLWAQSTPACTTALTPFRS